MPSEYGPGGIVSEQSSSDKLASEKKLVLKPPVDREDLLRYTENDPEGASEFLELLREFRGKPPSEPV